MMDFRQIKKQANNTKKLSRRVSTMTGTRMNCDLQRRSSLQKAIFTLERCDYRSHHLAPLNFQSLSARFLSFSEK
jgi:hypothetical protein